MISPISNAQIRWRGTSHELAHAADYDKGTLDRSVNPDTGVRRSEEKAMQTENKIRKEMGLPERTTYR